MWLPNVNSQKSITTKVVGGIGNQLFCYFAGYALARKLDYRLIVDVSDIRHGRSVHNVSIESFDLPGEFISTSNDPIAKLGKRTFNYFSRRLPSSFSLSNNYYSKVIGYDIELEKIKSQVKLNGYFQTYKYFEEYSHELLPLKLKTESDWYKSTLKEIDKTEYISIHLRRGDYRQLSQDYGLLGKDYYRDSLKKLDDLSVDGRIVVFSDEIYEARKILDGLVGKETYWVNPPMNVSSVESLALMSQASTNIIANSTYSWWGAALNPKNPTVIAPSKWFKNLDDPQDLYPPNWHLVESSWEA